MKPAIVVLVNGASGVGSDPDLADRLHQLFSQAGVDAKIHLAHGGEIEHRIEQAVAGRPDVIVAGGGDGTVSAVAAALAGSEIALGVLPLGTLNHFAKDLGIPLELEDAVAQIAAGPRMRIDVGEVNGRVFINNSSLGLYPDIVRDREQQQKRLGRGKWWALVWATLGALRRYPFLSVRLSIDGVECLRKTPFVFIGNNEYVMEGFAIGERAGLTDGCLSLYVAQKPGRLRLLLLALRALVGRLKQARDFDVMHAAEIVVESRHHRLRVATDGEVTVMTPPLHYRIRAGNLIVIGSNPTPAERAPSS
ncbi:MAG: diacylglycerol kinase family protein [Burkholderiaceae bacterium]